MTGATRRSLFAGIAALGFVPAVGAIASDPMAAWRGFGLAAEEEGIWPLMVEANALGFRPDQVRGICFKGQGGPSLSLGKDDGETVRIYPDHTLTLHARKGRLI